MLKYRQNSLNSCCLSSLASSFAIIKQTNSKNDIEMRIEESFKSEVGNRIDFASVIFKNKNILRASKECIIA